MPVGRTWPVKGVMGALSDSKAAEVEVGQVGLRKLSDQQCREWRGRGRTGHPKLSFHPLNPAAPPLEVESVATGQ